MVREKKLTCWFQAWVLDSPCVWTCMLCRSQDFCVHQYSHKVGKVWNSPTVRQTQQTTRQSPKVKYLLLLTPGKKKTLLIGTTRWRLYFKFLRLKKSLPVLHKQKVILHENMQTQVRWVQVWLRFHCIHGGLLFTRDVPLSLVVEILCCDWLRSWLV